MNIETVTLTNGWTVNYCRGHEEVFPPEATNQAKALLAQWVGLFPEEPTWVRREHGVPSLIVRLDCVVHANKLHIFEVEDRPCGIGVSSELNQEFGKRLNAALGYVGPIRWVSDPARVTDDSIWLGPGLGLHEALSDTSSNPLLVRSRPEHRDYYPLASRALSTVMREGDKRWMRELGLLRDFTWHPPEGLSEPGYVEPVIDGRFVLKLAQGTRAREIKVYLDGVGWDGVKSREDTINVTQFERLIAQGRHVVQPFIPPMRSSFLEGERSRWNMIYRMFFCFSELKEWVPIGGMWMATKSLIVHGTPNAVTGPLVVCS